jgi:diaminohydroxyphosphoribosylaminopyrimidine deaminase/5-amino-6-(5-phosphoribosylamino)uracil reductase
MDADRRFMRVALRLAARGAGLASPNPMVGAVLVRDGRVVATGWHRGPGLPHAEASAIAAAGASAAGCDLYVNLEPCCHVEKKTPPCVPAIAAAGVRRVVVAMEDPNPAVSGRGIAQLRARGIEVATGVLEADARRLNAAFEVFITTGRPHVTLKLATTLDGRIAARDGSSRWVSSEASRLAVQRMRAASDCVLVGSGTACGDDPLLLPRGVRVRRPPLRAVLDSDARLSASSQVARTADRGPVLVAVAEDAHAARAAALSAVGVEVVRLPRGPGGVSAGALLDLLGRRGVTTVLVEGGAAVAATLVREGLADRVVLFLAPMLLADPAARPWCDDLGLRTLPEAVRFELERVTRVGPDVRVDLIRVAAGGGPPG